MSSVFLRKNVHTLLLLFIARGSLVNAHGPTPEYEIAHGYLMAIAFGILFPLGAILVRVGRVAPHGFWQSFSYLVALAGFGIGAWIATHNGYWTASNGHAIIGTIVTAFLFFLPVVGLQAHRVYKQRGKNVFGIVHTWTARIMVTAGFINGGLGLMLTGREDKYIYAYSIVGGVLILAWWAFAMKSSIDGKQTAMIESKA